MKEVNVFETWINRITEGTWALPDTPEQEAKLQELMSAELIAGPDGTNATEQLYDIVGDDQLFDLINAAAAADPNTNIWDNAEIVGRLSELGVDVSNITQQGAEQTPEPAAAPAQPVAESRMAEVDSIIQSIIAGEADPYDIMNHPQGPEEQYVAQILQKEYEDVAIDHRLHPDDDFEQILDRVVDRLAQDHGHTMDEGWKGTLAGSAAGSVAGDVAGSAIGPAAGAALGGAVGGLPGAVAGGALGALAGGPVGATLGGLAGAKIGDKLGGSDDVDEADTVHSFGETTVAGSVAPMAGELEEEDQWGQAKQDPINYNAAITGSYYESEDPLARLKTLALPKR